MRNRYETILKKHFRTALIQLRRDSGMTQEQMAQKFCMSLRCYCNLESGKSCCSGVTLLIYLLRCEDSSAFLEEMRRALTDEKAGVI